MKKEEFIPLQKCSECVRKDQLVCKLEKLVHLKNKKQAKMSMDASSKLSSNGNIYQNSKNANGPQISSSIFSLISILQQLERTRYSTIFSIYKQTPGKKLGLLALSKNIRKQSLCDAFKKIKQHENKIDEDTMRTGEGMISIEKKKSEEDKNLECLYNDKRLSIISQQQLVNQKQLLKNIYKKFELIRQDIEFSSINKKQREIVELKVINNKQNLQINVMKQAIEELVRRQERQYQKKKNSLQELGEELVEKDQRIRQLQTALKASEAKFHSLYPNVDKDNILEDDPIALGKEVDRLQGIIDKLNIQISKIRDKNYQLQQDIEKLKQNQLALIAENTQLNEQKMKKKLQTEIFLKSSKQLTQLIQSIKIKSKRLSIYEKKLFEGQVRSSESKKIVQSLKSQIIFNYIANIDEPMYELKQQSLFDNDQKAALSELNQTYLKLLQKSQQKSHLVLFGGGIGAVKQKQQYKLPQNNNMRDMSDIFSMIQGNENHNNDRQDSIMQNSDRDQTSKQSITMRLLQMQLEKTKQIQKISQLKEKIMHIRILVLNLLKSLQLNESSLTQETKGTIQVFSDMFEYSEQQRASMFVKRKFFGFMR